MTKKFSVSEMIEDLSISTKRLTEVPPRGGITVWLPAEYKKKYDLIQKLSHKKFSKVIGEVIKRSIDSVSADGLVDEAS